MRYQWKVWRLGAASLWALGVLGGSVSLGSCKQGEGERCELTSDCEDGLECCLQPNSPYQNTCRTKCRPCGDGILDPGEACDDGNNVSGDGCKGDCSSDETCGNGIVDDHLDPPEECDPGQEQPDVDCAELGFQAGTAKCRPDCTLDLSGCEEGCGNGRVDGADECDGRDLGGLTCEDLGFESGELDCTDDCHFDPSRCIGGCGNGVLDPGEECDGQVDITCEDLGYDGGRLSCSETCRYDVSGCTGLEVVELTVDATTATGRGTADLTGRPDVVSAGCGPADLPDALFRVRVPGAGWYLAATEPLQDASAASDTVVSLLHGSDNPAAVACNDSDGPGRHGALVLSAGPGEEPLVAVSAPGGLVSLLVRRVDSPAGRCSAPVALPGPGLYGVVLDAAQDGDEQQGSCVGAGAPEAVFSYHMSQAGSLRVEVESIGGSPVGLYLRTGGCDVTGQELACSQGSYGPAMVDATGLDAGQEVFLVVEGNTEDSVTFLTLWVTEAN